MNVRAIQIDRTGGPEVMALVDRELAEPAPGEVRVRHRAIGINYTDVYQRSGLYKLPLPGVLGQEGAGVIEAIGADVRGFVIGDRVAYVVSGGGSYADARNIPATHVMKLPDSIDFARGAAMMLKGLTVDYLLHRTLPRDGLAADDYLVWHAAAGGVGSIACQWARALGLRLIATAGSPDKCELALAHGAAETIDYRREDVAARVRAITGGRGVKVVYDSVGKDTWHASLDCLAPFGLMVSYGNASGAVPPIALLDLMTRGSLYVTRPTLGTYIADAALVRAMHTELFAMVTSGKIAIAAPHQYALADAAQAHRDIEARATTGASVLVIYAPRPTRPSCPSSTSSATWLSPPSGTIRSAHRLLGSTCARCIGRTVA